MLKFFRRLVMNQYFNKFIILLIILSRPKFCTNHTDVGDLKLNYSETLLNGFVHKTTTSIHDVHNSKAKTPVQVYTLVSQPFSVVLQILS